MPWNSFAQGYNQARDHWMNRRSEAARAFSEFRSMHPNASYQDYRSFVDGITGGNSFVRGGIPADQILRSMAEENQRRYQQQQMMQQMEMLRYQAQTAGTIGALAERYSGMYDNDAEVEDMLVGNLGGSDFARQQVRQMFKGGFSPIRERARFNAIKDNLPLALQMLEANPDTDLSAMFPDMPKTFATGLSEAARKKYDEARRSKMNSAATELLQRGKTVIDMGGQPDFNGYEEEVVRIVRPQLDAYSQKVISEQQARQRKERLDLLKAAVEELKTDPGFLAEVTKPGFNALTVLAQRARQFGITDLSAEEAMPYIQDLQEDSVAAKKALLDQQRTTQLDSARETFSQGQKLAVESLASALENDESALFKASGPYAGAAAYAIKSLSTTYDLTDRNTRSLLARLVSADYLEAKGIDPANTAEIEAAILADPDFQKAATTIQSTRAIQEALVKNSTTFPEDLMTFDSWLSTYQSTTAEQIKEIEEKTVVPLLQQDAGLDSTSRIDHTIHQLQQLKLTIRDNVVKAASGADIWLIPGSGEFDVGAASQAGATRIYEIQALIDRLNAHKQAILQRAEGHQRAANEAALAAREHERRLRNDAMAGERLPVFGGQYQDTPPDPSWVPDAIPPGAPPRPGTPSPVFDALQWLRGNVKVGGPAEPYPHARR